MSDGVFLFSAEDGPVRVNAAGRRLLGFHAAGDVAAADLPAELIDVRGRARQGEVVQEEEIFLHPPGRRNGLWAGLSARSMADGQTTGRILVVARDQTERRAVRDSEALYHSLVDTLPMNVFRKDAEGRYTYVNALFCAPVGKPIDQLLGRTDFDVFVPELAAKYRQADLRLLAGREAVEEVEEHRTAACGPHCRCGRRGADDSDTTFVQVVLTPVLDAAGRAVGSQGVFWDVTPRVAAERRLRRVAADLERANAGLAHSNADLEQFAYVASHDLQEPLRMVSNYTQMLRRRYQGRLDADADEFIGYAVDGATHMQGLIDDLLTYSHVGNRGGSPQETDAGRAFARAVANLEAAVRESGAEVRARDLPVVLADPTRLVQLLQNLVHNGIKFHNPESSRGRSHRSEPPRVRVTARRDGDGWLFAVEDNGIGIEARHRRRIFDIFQRLHTRAEYPGNGVGLALCKRIVEQHGGRIWVESEPGRGSTFFFILPAGRPLRDGTPPLSGIAMSDRPSKASVDILLVEDNPGDVRLVLEAFREGGADVRLTAARDGEEALAVLRRRAPRRRAAAGADSAGPEPAAHGRPRVAGGDQGGPGPPAHPRRGPDQFPPGPGRSRLLRPARQLLHHQAGRPGPVH